MFEVSLNEYENISDLGFDTLDLAKEFEKGKPGDLVFDFDWELPEKLKRTGCKCKPFKAEKGEVIFAKECPEVASSYEEMLEKKVGKEKAREILSKPKISRKKRSPLKPYRYRY